MPAIERSDGTKEWWFKGERHRGNEKPAIEKPKNFKNEYWINGIKIE